MPVPDASSQRQRLLEIRSRLASQREHLRESGPLAEGAGNVAEFDLNHPADMGTEMFDREMSETLTENVEEMLHKVDRAIARLDAGLYGRCDDCGRPISKARLDAVPFAILCITCQARQES